MADERAPKPRGLAVTHEILETLGPVFSHGGLKNWDLCLAPEMVLAVPLGIWTSVKAGLFAAVGMHGRVQRVYAHVHRGSHPRKMEDRGDDSWRRYRVFELERITVRRSIGANEIRVSLRQRPQPDVYGIGHRDDTDRYRAVLARLYPTIYRDERL